jgi:type IV pilus assembly protein PilM
MNSMQQFRTRPRLACEVTVEGVIAGRAAEKAGRLELFTQRRIAAGALTPGLSAPNVLDGDGFRAAVRGALEAVAGKTRDVIVILPDAAIRVLLLEFETLPAKAQDVDPVIRFRLKKSLPFDVDEAAVSYDIRRHNGTIRVVAAVAPRSVIIGYEEAFRDVGFSPGVVVPSSLAALGLVEAQQPTLVLKVDPINITIAAAQNQELCLIRTLENPHGSEVSPDELAEAVLPSMVFFEDTFAAQVQEIHVAGVGQLRDLGNLLRQHTSAEVRELAPRVSSEQNLSGEHIDPSAVAGVAGALLG